MLPCLFCCLLACFLLRFPRKEPNQSTSCCCIQSDSILVVGCGNQFIEFHKNLSGDLLISLPAFCSQSPSISIHPVQVQSSNSTPTWIVRSLFLSCLCSIVLPTNRISSFPFPNHIPHSYHSHNKHISLHSFANLRAVTESSNIETASAASSFEFYILTPTLSLQFKFDHPLIFGRLSS